MAFGVGKRLMGGTKQVDRGDERLAVLSRRGLLKAAGAATLGLATGALSTAAARTGSSIGSGNASASVATAKLGVFGEPSGTEKGYFQAFTHFQSEVSRPVAIYRTYRGWGEPIITPLISSIVDPSQDNFLPTPELYVSFHAFLTSKGTKCIAWSKIASGCYDATIDAWASELDQLLSLKGHAYVTFHHEMENEEGTPPVGCGATGTNCGTPDDFKAAYWHFRARVQNRLSSLNGWPSSAITWVITYMGDTFRNKHGGPDRWWPSAADVSYVPGVPDDHLVGVDLYNRYKCHSKPWFSFQYLTDGVKGPGPQAYASSKGRKLFIGECGTVEGDACGGTLPNGTAKAQWYSDALALMKGWTNLEAFCYSQVSGFASGNYRIDTSSQAQAAFKALANDPLFS